MKKIQTLPVLQIRPNRLLYYNLSTYWEGDRQLHNSYKRYELHTEKTYSGDLKRHSTKRIRQAVSYLIATSPQQSIYNPVSNSILNFRINFLTLTLSAIVTADEEKKVIANVFKPFLAVLKTKFGVRSYVWKVERQQTTKNLHWHITTNRFIRFDLLRQAWNQAQEREGIITKFKAQHGHSDPNSTDIHSVQSVHNLEGYISKYVSKMNKEGEEKCPGKVWGCSRNLMGIKNFSALLEDKLLQMLQEAESLESSKKVVTESCEIVTLESKEFDRLIEKYEVKEYRELLHSISSLR